MSRYVFLLTLLSIFLLTCAKTFKDRQGTKLVVVTGTNFFHQSGQDFPESEVIDLESDTGKSFSEAFILTSTNPQYDKRFFIDLPVQYVHENYKLRTCCVHKLF